MNTSRFWLLLLVAVLLVVHPARAQYTDSMGYGGWNNPMSSMVSTMLWSRLIYRTPAEYKSGRLSSGTATTGSTSNQVTMRSQSQQTNATDDRSVKFRSSGTYVRTKDLADQLGNSPEERAQYLKLMNTVLDGFGQKAQSAGLQNDLALALSYFLGENVRIYRGLPELSDEQYIGLRNAIADALVSTGALSGATDRQKQEFYEALVAYTGITQYGYEQGLQAKNDAIIKGFQKIAGQNLQTVTKISPDSINFGANGLSGSGEMPQDQTATTVAAGTNVDINQFRGDYSENEIRANQIYKGNRFVFTGTVVEVSGNYYKTTGQDSIGRPIVSNLGTNLRLSSVGGPTVIGYEVHCFFRDKNQLAQLRGQQRVTLEATVQGREEGSSNLILVDAVLR